MQMPQDKPPPPKPDYGPHNLPKYGTNQWNKSDFEYPWYGDENYVPKEVTPDGSFGPE